MKRGIFSRMFFLYALVLVLALVFSETYITGVVRKNQIETLKSSLTVQAALMAGDISFEKRPVLDSLCKELRERTGARVTIIFSDGTVLGDSDAPSSAMENHLGRPEIQQAIVAGNGYSVRRSGTVGHDLLYAAHAVAGDGRPEGFVRLSVPLTEVYESVKLLRLRILLAVALVLLATGATSLMQTGRIRRLVRQITEFSSALARGQLERRLILEGVGEFEEIAGNLNKMAEELRDMLSRNKEEYERLNAILRSIPDALLIIDGADIVVLSSAASREFFGITKVAGRPVSEVVRATEFFDLLDEAKRSQGSEEREVPLDFPRERYTLVKVSPLMYEEKPSGFIAIFHDITGMKKLESVRKDFVANISHELKTPITAIKGFADTLIEGALDDRENALRFAKIIKSNSERINNLVDDLMTISKIELGVMRISKAEVDMADVLDHVTSTLAEHAKAKGLTLDTAIEPAASRISADRGRLVQILTNLIDNAIKFTNEGGVTVGTGLEDGAPYIFVKDTGIGIPEKHLPRIGERFYRVDPSRSRELGGTGLGLAIVKHLVNAHGWKMHIESTEGKGTTVKILIA